MEKRSADLTEGQLTKGRLEQAAGSSVVSNSSRQNYQQIYQDSDRSERSGHLSDHNREDFFNWTNCLNKTEIYHTD
jgi:hypothetical protein